MGLIGNVLGLGRAARDVAEVFVPNKTQRQAFEHQEHAAALAQYGQEYGRVQDGGFNRFVNGLNRLPRPVLALGTVGLFGFAMADPASFSLRMRGLDTVPSELWWLLGAIVSFYFGARELHYQRVRKGKRPPERTKNTFVSDTEPDDENPAVREWQNNPR